MCAALREGQLDIAVALTEGLVADLVRNGPCYHIVAEYVQSPLNWGIAVAADSSIKTLSELEGSIFGISRFGSGSHIMAFVMAERDGWKIAPRFSEAGGLEDLVKSVTGGKSNVFLWETMMLRSAVRAGKLRELGLLPTPWPCFHIAVTDEYLEREPEVVNRLVQCLTATASHWQYQPVAVADVMAKCDITEAEAKQWLSGVKFSTNGTVSDAALDLVLATLKRLQLGTREVTKSQLYLCL